MHKSSTETIIAALYILSKDIQSDDGVASSALVEAAERLSELDYAIRRMVEDNPHLRNNPSYKELEKLIEECG